MDPVTLILGAVVSVVVEVVKKWKGTSKLKTMATLVGLSLVSGLGLYLLQSYGLWESALQVLVFAGASYGLIVKNVESAIEAK